MEKILNSLPKIGTIIPEKIKRTFLIIGGYQIKEIIKDSLVKIPIL